MKTVKRICLTVLSAIAAFALFACEQNGGQLVNENTAFTTVIYGTYAQNRVTDATLVNALGSASGWQDDRVTYNNTVYERVTAAPFSKQAKFNDGETITEGETYYFTVMPVEWYVLSKGEGGTTLLSKNILDVQVFNTNVDAQPDNDGNYVNNWEYSTLREWLNDTFYKKAFNAAEGQAINKTKNASAHPEAYYVNHSRAIRDTWDQVYCLSYAEAVNKDGKYNYTYSFSENMVDYDCLRMAKVTDYAKARGAWFYINVQNEDYKDYDLYTHFDGNGKYWLRTVGQDAIYAAVVRYTGEVGRAYENVGYKYSKDSKNVMDVGVRPAITVGFDATAGK